MHELGPIIAALWKQRARRYPWRRCLRRAAVAVILRETRQGAEVLIVERAQRDGDPWSGDMALPGGRIQAEDWASGSRAACRETAEEIGVTLDRGLGLGRLSDRLVPDHSGRRPMVVSPFVYRWPTHAAIETSQEIADWQWLALGWLDAPIHRQRMIWHIGRLAKSMPCYDCGNGRRLWGLTLTILDELVRIARRSDRQSWI